MPELPTGDARRFAVAVLAFVAAWVVARSSARIGAWIVNRQERRLQRDDSTGVVAGIKRRETALSLAQTTIRYLAFLAATKTRTATANRRASPMGSSGIETSYPPREGAKHPARGSASGTTGSRGPRSPRCSSSGRSRAGRSRRRPGRRLDGPRPRGADVVGEHLEEEAHHQMGDSQFMGVLILGYERHVTDQHIQSSQTG